MYPMRIDKGWDLGCLHYLDTEKFSNILSETIENLEKDFIVLKELIQDDFLCIN